MGCKENEQAATFLVGSESFHPQKWGIFLQGDLLAMTDSKPGMTDKKRTSAEIKFAQEILNMLDEVVRGTPALQDFIYPIKESIRNLRDRK